MVHHFVAVHVLNDEKHIPFSDAFLIVLGMHCLKYFCARLENKNLQDTKTHRDGHAY